MPIDCSRPLYASGSSSATEQDAASRTAAFHSMMLLSMSPSSKLVSARVSRRDIFLTASSSPVFAYGIPAGRSENNIIASIRYIGVKY